MEFKKADHTLYEPDPINPLYLMGAAGVNAFPGMDAARSAALTYFAEHLVEGWSPVRSAADGVRTLARRYKLYRQTADLLGANPKIPVTDIEAMLAEVRSHRWIEAEKAGADIWSAVDPENPDRAALRDWFAKHYHNWRAARTPKAA